MQLVAARQQWPAYISPRAQATSQSTNVRSTFTSPSSILQYVVKQPLLTLDAAEKYDIVAHLDGGGYKGQAEALRLAIARALVKVDPEDKAALRKEGFMTRDAREVERKKPGRPKARKRFQFSKR